MLVAAVMTVTALCLLALKFGKKFVQRLIGLDIFVDVVVTIFFMWVFAITGTISGMLTGIAAGLMVGLMLYIARMFLPHQKLVKDDNGRLRWTDVPGELTGKAQRYFNTAAFAA